MFTSSVSKNIRQQSSFSSIPHLHKFYELYILTQGKRRVYIEETNYELSAGDFLLIPKNLVHGTAGEAYTRYLLVFTEEGLDQEQIEIMNSLLRQKISMTPEETKRVIDILEIMLKLEYNQTKDSQEMSSRNFQICFDYFFFTLSTLRNFPTSRYLYSNVSSYSQLTRKVINHINAQYHRPDVNLDRLSKYFFVSKSKLCHQFKLETGMTVIDYLLKVRIRQAQNFLQYTAKSIAEISNACGFSSPNYFSLIFNKHVQCSPREYRKMHQIKSP